MARVNNKVVLPQITTHEGGKAVHISPELQLRRSVLACMLWEDTFYESGKSIAERIGELCAQVKPEVLAELAIEARHKQHLRHVPLLLLRNLVKLGKGNLVADTIYKVISRADELAEFVAVYREDKTNKKMIPAQMKKGLARAFGKFDEYQLAKWNRDAAFKLRDVMRLCHPQPKDEEQAALWKRLINKELATPDTWETQLSAGADKKETFERLIREKKLGYFALIRNLRNVLQAGCDLQLVKNAILARENGAHNILPFRFIGAARAAPQFERELDISLCETINSLPRLSGTTAVLVDVSGSMDAKLSAKSDLSRKDAAAALASVINGDHLRVFSFTTKVMELPARKGMAGVDSIVKSQNGGTTLFQAIAEVNTKVNYDRLIVITDEQAFPATSYGLQKRASGCPEPLPGKKGYMINVASYQNGVGYGAWNHIDGFSENVIKWIYENEARDDL